MKRYISSIVGIVFAIYVFYSVYGPQDTLKKQIENNGMDFEYVTEEGSCFTQRADPVGPESHKYILSLHRPEPSNKQEPVYVMIGYMMKQVRLKNKSNVFQSQLSNTL